MASPTQHHAPRIVVACAPDGLAAGTALAAELGARFRLDAHEVHGDALLSDVTLSRAEAVVLHGTRHVEDPRIAAFLDLAARRGIPVLALADDARSALDPVGQVVLPISASVDQVAGVLRGLQARTPELERLRTAAERADLDKGGLRIELERMHDELQLAASVQREFLPRSLPTLGRLACAALWRPAAFVSGDIYNVQRLDEHHLGVFVSDAVGHGVPAALLTLIIARSFPMKEITGESYRLVEPAEALAQINRDLLARNSKATRFATAAYAVIDERSLAVKLASGGHPPPLRLRPDGSITALESRGGLLGVFEDETYQEASASLGPGDWLLIHSDGFEQVFSPPSQVGGQARIPSTRYLDVFSSLAGLRDPRAFVDAVARRVDAEMAEEDLPDDLTLVCVKVAP